MPKRNAFYAQSGGVTAVINASACGVIETARANKAQIGKVLVGRNGILGALNEELIDTSKERKTDIAGLRSTPGGAFGSCRFKLKSLQEDAREYQRLIEVFKAHNIGYFFYNGGGDSQDTANKVSQLGKQMGYPLQAIGVPKTVDNDLPLLTHAPASGRLRNTWPPQPRKRHWMWSRCVRHRPRCLSLKSWADMPVGLPQQVRSHRNSPATLPTLSCCRKWLSTKKHFWPR